MILNVLKAYFYYIKLKLYYNLTVNVKFNTFRRKFPSDSDQNAESPADGCYSVDDRGVKKYLFKKRSTSSTCAVNMCRNNKGELLVRSSKQRS